MGVGKTRVCRELQKMLPKCVFLDGDWCWDMSPFVVTEETKAMVMDNICHLLNNFLRCSLYENIVFCWVLHEQSILDEILSRLDVGAWRAEAVSLTCSEAVLRDRLRADVDAGIRQADILERSPARLPLYEGLNTRKVDTTGKTPEKIAEEIIPILDKMARHLRR